MNKTPKIEPAVAMAVLVFNKLIDDYEADHHILFCDDAERRRVQYAAVSNRLRAWKHSRRCVFRGCNRGSVKRSHTIQRNASLKRISDEGLVLTPEFDQETGTMRMMPKGISWASTFPGFCEDHEKMFRDYENRKQLEKDEDFVRQIYRTICREIVRLRHAIDTSRRSLSAFIEYREKKLLDLLKQRLGRQFWLDHPGLKPISMEFKDGDALLQPIKDFIVDSEEDLLQLSENHLPEIESELLYPGSTCLSPIILNLDIEIPVALAGMASFCIEDAGEVNRVLAILNVLPFAEGTHIIIHGRLADTKHIHSYFSHWNDTFKILNMVESWMIRGTDHWFLRPSVWGDVMPVHQNRMLTDIQDFSKGIGQIYPLSIFNLLRTKLLACAKAQVSAESDNEFLTTAIEREEAKLARSMMLD